MLTDTYLLSVALFCHLLTIALHVHAQASPSFVAEPCTAGTDRGILGRTSEQITCGVHGRCGGKGAVCYYDGNYHGYMELYVSRKCLFELSRMFVATPPAESTDRAIAK